MPLGKDWTWYTPHNPVTGEMNILSDPGAIVASRILHLLLTECGRDPIHPTLGIAPKLFEPLSAPSAQYFVYHAREEILKWNDAAKIGISSLSVEVEDETIYRNDITINIAFVPTQDSFTNVLTFSYFAYTGVKYDGSLKEFRDGVTLNGQPFPYFTPDFE